MKKFSIYAALAALVCMAALGFADIHPSFAQPAPNINPAKRKTVYVPVQNDPAKELELIAVGTVKEILKSSLIKLENGKVFSLINVRIPFLYDDKALEHIKKNYIGKKVGVYRNPTPGVSHADKSGNLTGHVVTEENIWLQADLVLKGLAWADSSVANRDLVRKLYQFEAVARSNKAGFWSSPVFSIKNGKSVQNELNSFQVVEDVVRSVKYVGQLIYFGFGDNPAKDFTIHMDSILSPNFQSPDGYAFKPYSWIGQRIRVRGWVRDSSGPMIEVTHPEQIEFVGFESRPRSKKDQR